MTFLWHVLRLRQTVTFHQLRRDWWRVLILIGGVIWSFSLVPAVLVGARWISFNASDVKADVLVSLAAIFLAGWVVVPLLVTGLDDTLAPARFASLGLRPGPLAAALTISALVSVPALFFLFLFGASAWLWHNENPDSWPLVVGIVGAALTWTGLVLSARLATSWGSRILGSRRSRDVAVGIAVLVLALGGPALWIVVRDGLELVLDYDVRVLIEQLGRTPIGAGMAAPEHVVDRDWWGAGWRLGMMAAWVSVLYGAWRANVAHALVNPLFRGGGTRRREDSILALGQKREIKLAIRNRTEQLRPARTAVRARLERYWVTDPRYLSNLIGALVLPLMLMGLVSLIGGLDDRWMFVAPLALALTLGWGRHNDVALDSTGLWLDVVSGRLGRDVMRGRFAATAIWAVPVVAATALGVVAWTGLWVHAFALVGASVGLLGTTLGVSAVSSVVFPYRAPAPGESPFAAEVGSVGAGFVAQIVSSLATAAVAPFVVTPLFWALVSHPGWGVVSAVTGPVLGALAYVWGVRLAGTMYDRRSGRLVGLVQ